MTYSSLQKSLSVRLDEAVRGDRGWWVITRVHLTTARLRDITRYLLDVGAESDHALTKADYRSIGRLVEVAGSDPGVQLRRHQLLAMEKPLQLIERADGRNWATIRLTQRGVILATAMDPAAVLEQLLSEITFCAAPFYPRSRVRRYQEFSIAPYPTTLQTLAACGGWIDRDEFDLFLSRVRDPSEAAWAIAAIGDYRKLDGTHRASLLAEVESRMPGAKSYQNWRDMGPHHFSLFALGTSAIRDGNRLVLSARFLEEPSVAAGAGIRMPRARHARRKAPIRSLKIPEPKAPDELAAPPTTPATNSGTDAEILVGKLLQAAGWSIVYYSAKRGYGFDIWARKGKAAILIEVKSSFGQLGAIMLTRLEHEAAKHHGPNFVLAIVEELGEKPKIRFVSDPVAALVFEAKTVEAYAIARDAWDPVAGQSWE